MDPLFICFSFSTVYSLELAEIKFKILTPREYTVHCTVYTVQCTVLYLTLWEERVKLGAVFDTDKLNLILQFSIVFVFFMEDSGKFRSVF